MAKKSLDIWLCQVKYTLSRVISAFLTKKANTDMLIPW